MPNRKTLGRIESGHISAIREMSEAEYSSYLTNNKIITQFADDQTENIILHTSKCELDDMVSRFRDQFAESKGAASSKFIRHYRIHLNRLLANALNAINMFLDHWENRYKLRYGEESEEYDWFKKAKGWYWDNSLSYRLMYCLRNFTIHNSLPIGEINLLASTPNPGVETSGSADYKVEILLNRDTLINTGDYFRKMKDDLSGLPPSIDFYQHTNAMVEMIKKFNEGLLFRDLESIKKSKAELMAIIDSIPGEGQPAIFLDFPPPKEKRIQINVLWFPLDEMKHIT